MILGITLPLAMGAGIALGMFVLAPKPPLPAPVASVAKPKVDPVPSAAPPQTLSERAASGDYKALDDLKARPPEQRTAEETLALARGRSHNKGLALEGFEKEIQKNPDLLKDKDQLARLKDFLNDRETTNQAAGVLVALPGTLGPDLLYEATSSKNRETAELADNLLATKEVRDKASPALLVALDLRHAEQCEQFKELLPRVAEQGDRRSLPALNKLVKKKGCGDNGQADCYECLRPLEKDKDAIDLVDATKAALHRPAPKL
jgi:hypothetical protein